MSIEELIAGIRSPDDRTRGKAWKGAASAGAAAVEPLAEVMATGDFEIARAAKRALWVIVRHAGRPGAGAERERVLPALESLLGDDRAVTVRREALWMLSELCDGATPLEALARLLTHSELREDARCALERIPGAASLTALREALPSAPREFQFALAQSLRARGERVEGLPCRKLVPTRPTAVKPVNS